MLAPSGLFAKKYPGYDSSKVFVFFSDYNQCCFEFYRDSTFACMVGAGSVKGCMHVEGRWSFIDNKIILHEEKRGWPGFPDSIQYKLKTNLNNWQMYEEKLNDTLQIQHESRNITILLFRKISLNRIRPLPKLRHSFVLSVCCFVPCLHFGIGSDPKCLEKKYNIKLDVDGPMEKSGSIRERINFFLLRMRFGRNFINTYSMEFWKLGQCFYV